MLDADAVRLRLDETSLPTGMTATVIDDPFEGIEVRLLYQTPDSFNPGKQVDLGIPSYLSPNDRASVETLDRWIVWRVWRVFGHEAREQVQRDGKPISDPHAPRVTM